MLKLWGPYTSQYVSTFSTPTQEQDNKCLYRHCLVILLRKTMTKTFKMDLSFVHHFTATFL